MNCRHLWCSAWLAGLIASYAQAEDAQSALNRLRQTPGISAVQMPIADQQASGPFFLQGKIAVNQTAPGVIKPTALSREQQARNFLLQHKTLWDIASNEELQLIDEQRDSHGQSHIKFIRRWANWPIQDATLAVHFTADGDIQAINGNAVALPDAAKTTLSQLTQAPLDEQAAFLQVRTQLNAARWILHSQALLVTPTAPYLIWQWDMTDPLNHVRHKIISDAFNGAIISDRQHSLREGLRHAQ